MLQGYALLRDHDLEQHDNLTFRTEIGPGPAQTKSRLSRRYLKKLLADFNNAQPIFSDVPFPDARSVRQEGQATCFYACLR